jgi:hypoxanthine phosphoribosyltransferase
MAELAKNVKVFRPSWDDIESLCLKVAQAIKGSGFTPEIIVGIQRGGCVPAVVFSHVLGVADFCTIGVRTTTSERIRASRQIPVVRNGDSLHLVAGKQVLLVDDVTNTGATLVAAKDRVLSFGCRVVKTAVIICDTPDVQSCQVDYYGTSVDAWVVFPWEEISIDNIR